MLCGSVHKQIHKAAAPINLCGGFGAALFSGPCARLLVCSTLYLVASASIDGKLDIGTHTRTPTRKRYTTRIHGASASHRIAAHQMLCKQFVPFPALTPNMHGALPLPHGRTPCERALVRCVYECSVPVAAQPTHSFSGDAVRVRMQQHKSTLCLLD